MLAEDEMVGCHHRLNGCKSEQTPGDGEGQGSLACCSPGVVRSQTRLTKQQQQQRVGATGPVSLAPGSAQNGSATSIPLPGDLAGCFQFAPRIFSPVRQDPGFPHFVIQAGNLDPERNPLHTLPCLDGCRFLSHRVFWASPCFSLTC